MNKILYRIENQKLFIHLENRVPRFKTWEILRLVFNNIPDQITTTIKEWEWVAASPPQGGDWKEIKLLRFSSLRDALNRAFAEKKA